MTLLLTPRPDAAKALAAACPGARPAAGGALVMTVPQAGKLQALAHVTALPGLADLEVLPPSLEDIYAHHSAQEAAA